MADKKDTKPATLQIVPPVVELRRISQKFLTHMIEVRNALYQLRESDEANTRKLVKMIDDGCQLEYGRHFARLHTSNSGKRRLIVR